MKRWCRIAVALTVALALAAGALAEPKLVGEFEDVNWIIGSNLLYKQGRGGYSIVNIDGEAITGEDFARRFDYRYGQIVTQKVDVSGVNCLGTVNLEGTEVIPFQYGDIKVANEYWALAYTFVPATADNYDYGSVSGDVYYLIDKVAIYNIEKGWLVCSFARANFEDFYVHGNTINIKDRASGVITAYDADFSVLGTGLDSLYADDYAPQEITTFRDNGQQGLMDSEGNVIMEPSFQMIDSFYGDYAEVSTGDTSGLIDVNGNVVIPAEYEDIKFCYNGSTPQYNNFGYFCVVKDGRLGYVRSGGEVSCEPKYAAEALENNGASATYTDIEGKLHIIAGDGVEAVLEGYGSVYPADFSAGAFYKVRDADYHCGLIDFHGNVVLPCEYEDIALSGDGHYALVDVDYERSELYELDYSAIVGGAEATGEAILAAEAPAAEEALVAEAAEGTPAAGEAPMSEAAEETPALEEVTAEAAAVNSEVANYLDAAILMLNADAAGNGSATASLLGVALEKIGADSPVGGLLASAITLLEADAGANGAAVITLLESAKALL